MNSHSFMRVQVRVQKKYFFEFEFGKMIEFFEFEFMFAALFITTFFKLCGSRSVFWSFPVYIQGCKFMLSIGGG